MTESVVPRSCGTCGHWKPAGKREGYGNALSIRPVDVRSQSEWEVARKAEHDADLLFGECQGIVMGTDVPLGDPIPLATVRDGSDYVATLYTQAEFGCAMWSAPPYLCEPCRRGEHWRCSEPGTCECTEPVA